MTINITTMKQDKNCEQLNMVKKIKIKVDEKARILYVNPYFTEFTGFKVSDIILKDFETIVHPSMPKMMIEKLNEIAQQYGSFYFIHKGLLKDGGCYWSFIRVTQRINEQNEFSGYLLEGKMLPEIAIQKVDKLVDVIKEIENNAGIKAALNYFDGFIEDKGLEFNDFILSLTEVSPKKALQYFEIDEDANASKKKKKSWF